MVFFSVSYSGKCNSSSKKNCFHLFINSNNFAQAPKLESCSSYSYSSNCGDMNQNAGYYYDTSDTAADSSLISSVSGVCPNSNLCGSLKMCHGSGDSTVSTHVYESNYAAPGGSTLTSNRLPNLYQVC